jgi:putative oxidoreductase
MVMCRVNGIENSVLLGARILLMTLFLISGWDKLTDYPGAVTYMVQVGAMVPPVAAIIAIVMELFVPVVVLLGVLTRPLAILLALYTLSTAMIGHHYWSMTGTARLDNMIHFYKNISIVGGLLFLYVTGPGAYSAVAMTGSLGFRHWFLQRSNTKSGITSDLLTEDTRDAQP